MKPEPLRKEDIMYYPHDNKTGFIPVDKHRLAVEWLREQDLIVHNDFIDKKINYLTLVQRLGNNRKKAFEDVTKDEL